MTTLGVRSVDSRMSAAFESLSHRSIRYKTPPSLGLFSASSHPYTFMIHLRPHFLIAALVLLHSVSTPAYSKKSKAKARGDVSSDNSRTYYLNETYCGENFFEGFNWETLDDPTHGRVNYIDKGAAMTSNLSFGTSLVQDSSYMILTPSTASYDKFIMRVDSTNYVSPSARGRDSVRIISNNAYEECIIVLDIQHMPEGCGTWPAFWTLSSSRRWPYGGEIDIIEGKPLYCDS
jgi:hypothetical protein